MLAVLALQVLVVVKLFWRDLRAWSARPDLEAMCWQLERNYSLSAYEARDGKGVEGKS